MLLLFLLQVGVVVAVAQAFGRLFQKLGQPRVVGEMFAGIALGPSLLGNLAPKLHQALFPEASLGLLTPLGQLGLVFYMFFVGVTLNLDHLHNRRAAALLTSLGSIVIPFVSGFILAFFVYHRLVGPAVSLTAFSLFLGVCMAITAFPVLARILQETGIIKTPLGAIAIACAAMDDICAWLILAGILGFLQGSARHWPMWQTGATLGAYLLVMLGIRRVFGWLTEGEKEKCSGRGLSLALLVAIGSSIATEWIGIHALFGAFFAGVIMPKKRISSNRSARRWSLLRPQYFCRYFSP